MSIIQTIQEKYAKLMAIIIALALVIFVVMLAFENGGSLFSSNTTTVGEVNGKKIERAEFGSKVDAQEEAARAQNYDMGEAGRQQILESVWNQEVEAAIMEDEYEALGMHVSTKEINDYLFGNNAPAELRQRFVDSATGQFNAGQLQQYINDMKKNGTAEQKTQLNQYIAALKQQRRMEKYVSLLSNTVYVPKWFIEKQNSDNSLLGKAAYVNVPYASISDSAVNVSDDEIRTYINEHRKQFEQKEEVRSINFVVFDASPSASDSAAARNALITLRNAFDTAKNYETFLAQNSAFPFNDSYISKTDLRQVNKDSILSAPTGTVYGPYLDASENGGAFYVYSKILSTRSLADTAKVRHILISTNQRDPNTQQLIPVRSDAEAKKLADSVRGLLAGGQPFDSLVARLSEDPGKQQNNGVYENITSGSAFVPEFKEFALTNPVGKIDIVKTDFGYHIMEVMSSKGNAMGYKIAYLARPIETSTETENTASTAASRFAADSRNLDQFNSNFDKNLRNRGMNKLTAPEIRPNDFNINGLGTSRTLVRSIFEADKGDVVAPERVGNAYVVAVVTDIMEPGLRSVAQVRTLVEPVLKNRKKAGMIRQRIGAVSTLEAAAAKIGQPIQQLDSLRFNGGNQTLGFESRVIGAVFNPANKGKVVPEPIEGQAGVYVVRVDAISATPVDNASIEQQRMQMMMQARQAAMQQSPVQALKNAAKIEDNRAKFY